MIHGESVAPLASTLDPFWRRPSGGGACELSFPGAQTEIRRDTIDAGGELRPRKTVARGRSATTKLPRSVRAIMPQMVGVRLACRVRPFGLDEIGRALRVQSVQKEACV
eukprot:scaffold15228_cov118-Isochrysis_galbana.AAC.3